MKEKRYFCARILGLKLAVNYMGDVGLMKRARYARTWADRRTNERKGTELEQRERVDLGNDVKQRKCFSI